MQLLLPEIEAGLNELMYLFFVATCYKLKEGYNLQGYKKEKKLQTKSTTPSSTDSNPGKKKSNLSPPQQPKARPLIQLFLKIVEISPKMKTVQLLRFTSSRFCITSIPCDDLELS